MYKLLFLLLPILLFSKIEVTTTLPFESFIVKQIGQQHIRIKEITNLYSSKIKNLNKKEISRLSNAKIYFNFGLNMEEKYGKILLKSNPNLIINDMSKGINKIEYNGKQNPYIWLDPILLRKVAKNIYVSLLNIDTFNKKKYKENYNLFLNKLDEVYLKTRKVLEKSENYNIFVYDEYFDYYAKRFKINLYKKEKKIQKSKDIKKLNSFAKTNQINLILIPQNDNIIMANSIASNLAIKIRKHDIFIESIFVNIKTLTDQFL